MSLLLSVSLSLIKELMWTSFCLSEDRYVKALYIFDLMLVWIS